MRCSNDLKGTALSTITLNRPAEPTAGVGPFLLRRLHSLTGLVFGGYIVVHLLVNATMLQGQRPDVYQAQVDKIHSLPFLLAVEWIFIFLPIIFHTLYGIWMTFTCQPNLGRYPYSKNVYYTLQRISAIIIAAFIVFHVLGMKGFFGSTLEFQYGPGQATATTVRHINANWAIAYVVYPLGILASCYHLANGFWTAAITWGLTVSAGAQRRWGWVCGALFVLVLGCGMAAWITALRLKGMVVPA
jgi:succinate dehydrogenase / fumarate reductase cytochrome b subunit